MGIHKIAKARLHLIGLKRQNTDLTPTASIIFQIKTPLHPEYRL